MSGRQNSVFKIMPKRAASLSKCIVDQGSRQNKFSNYSKVINIDGTKSGDVYKLQNFTNMPLKQRMKRPQIQSNFQNKLLSFLMVAVKNQYKNFSRKRQSVKNRQTNGQPISKNNKSHFLGRCYNNEMKINTKQLINVQKKQIIQQNSSNCLKNKLLSNIKLGKAQDNFDLIFPTNYNQLFKHQNASHVQSNYVRSPKAQIINFMQDNQEGYLTSQIEEINFVSKKRKASRTKTQQLKKPHLDDVVREYLSLEKKKYKGTQNQGKSEGVRVFSAMQLFSSQQQKIGKIKLYSPLATLQKQQSSKYCQNRFISKSVFDGYVSSSKNDTFKVTNLPKRLPIYSRKKRNLKNDTLNNQLMYFEHF